MVSRRTLTRLSVASMVAIGPTFPGIFVLVDTKQAGPVATGRYNANRWGEAEGSRHRAGRQSASGQCVQGSCAMPPVSSPAATLRFGQNVRSVPFSHFDLSGFGLFVPYRT